MPPRVSASSPAPASVLDAPLPTGRPTVSLSAFAFLFSELVQYHQSRVSNINELERKLEEAGFEVGVRVLELLCTRERGNRRETRLQGILQFIHTNVWRSLFGRVRGRRRAVGGGAPLTPPHPRSLRTRWRSTRTTSTS